MKFKPSPVEILLICTVIGIAATFAAPWFELRGTYAAWRIVEWHTFWRGEDAFLLGSVVAPDYQVSIEYATREMQSMLSTGFALGSALGLWHGGLLVALVALGARMRLLSGESPSRVARELATIVGLNAAILRILIVLLALPSTITPKVDFRTGAEVHSDSLVWSSISLLPVAPAFAMTAAIIGGFALVKLVRRG